MRSPMSSRVVFMPPMMAVLLVLYSVHPFAGWILLAALGAATAARYNRRAARGVNV